MDSLKWISLLGVAVLANALTGCSSTESKQSPKLSVNKASSQDASEGAAQYQAVLSDYGLYLDNAGQVIYQDEPDCSGMTHYDVVFQSDVNRVIVGDEESTGIVLPVEQRKSVWFLRNSQVEIEPLLDLSWPLKPKRVRLELYGQWDIRSLRLLSRYVTRKWADVTVDWSANRMSDVPILKEAFDNVSVGYHGRIIGLTNAHANADFFSINDIELEIYATNLPATEHVELRLKDSQQFYQWLDRDPDLIRKVSGTAGALNRYPLCARASGISRVHQTHNVKNPYLKLPAQTDFSKHPQLKALVPSGLYITLDGEIRSLKPLDKQDNNPNQTTPSLLLAPKKPVRIILNDDN